MVEQVEIEQQNLPAKIAPRNRLVMLRFLEGQTIEAIALHFQLQPSTISSILNSPMVRQEMEQMSHTATERIANLTDEAVDLVRDTMRGEINSELRFKAATRLLDYNPELNPKKSDMKDFGEGLGESMIRAIHKQLRETERPNESENSNFERAINIPGSDDSPVAGKESSSIPE